MLVAASVTTRRLDLLRKRWKLEGVGLPPVAGAGVVDPSRDGRADTPAELTLEWEKPDYVVPAEGSLGPSYLGDLDYAGAFLVYDWDTKEVIWQPDFGAYLVSMSGFCFADGHLYLTDLEAGNIFQIDFADEPGKLLRRISHPYLNDIHGLVRSRRGLLVACSGTDCIVELDLDGNLLWDWWAADHGYLVGPSGKEKPAGRDRDHRTSYYHTRYQTTHVNVAQFADEAESQVLALLFHQGQLIRIDRTRPAAEQAPEVLVEGLVRPHSLEKTPDGWMLCNSVGPDIVLLDEEFRVVEKVRIEDAGWLQDATRLSDGHYLINDIDNHRVLEVAAPDWNQRLAAVPYNDAWRMAELVEVPAEYAARFAPARAAVSLR